MGNLKTYISVFLLLISVSQFFSCKNTVTSAPCLAPIPSITIKLVTATAEPSSLYTSEQVKISYSSSTGTKAYISLTKKNTSANIFSTYDLLDMSHTLGNTTPFSLEIDGVKKGELVLVTYKAKTDCDGWVYVSELKFNNQVLTPINGFTYTINL